MDEGDALGSEGMTLPSLPDVANTLVLAPASAGQLQSLCLDALTQTDPENTHALAISYNAGPAEWIDAWEERTGVDPASGGIVSVGENEFNPEDPGFDTDIWDVVSIEKPADLTGVGIEMSDILSDMAKRADPDERVVMAFDSITTLLQYADVQRTFKFLHVVTGRVRTADASAVYVMNPIAHDTQDKATLTSLFEATIENEHDEWHVNS